LLDLTVDEYVNLSLDYLFALTLQLAVLLAFRWNNIVPVSLVYSTDNLLFKLSLCFS
jgi:hypothetical protein